MIGYHYTSEENWLKIKEEGLIPYRLDKSLVDPQDGIWVYKSRQFGRSHTGCVMYQAWSKHTFSVVELAVAFKDKWLVNNRGQEYAIRHDGGLSDYKSKTIIWGHYHLNEPATIVWKSIPPECIQLLGIYKFEEAWSQQREPLTIDILERANVERFEK